MKHYLSFISWVSRYKCKLTSNHFALAAISFWSPTSKPTIEIAQTLGTIVVVALILVFVVAKIRKFKSEPLLMSLDDAAFIDSILLRAAEKEIRFDLICTRSGLTHRHLQGYCRIPDEQTNNGESCRDDNIPNIILDLHPGSVANGWDAAPIDVYIQISQKDTCTLYHFASFVCSITQKIDGTVMEIIRPSILSDSKAKDTVRIEPTPEMIALSSLWFYNSKDTILPQNVPKLGPPHAIYKPGNSDFLTVSISASSIRLRFLRDTIDEMELPLKKGHQICMLLAINTHQERGGKILLWLKGVCTGFAPCVDRECLDALFSFTHWQQIFQRSDKIEWYPATDTDRVPPLMHWILHAEQETEEIKVESS